MTALLRRWLTWRSIALGALAGQYVLFQALTGVQYWDSPRNLHWGIVVQETPRFLIDAENPYDRVNGFTPDPPSLAPAGLADGRSGPLHPWWGPLYLILFGVVWRLSGSYAALQSIVPLAAGAAVLLTYALGSQYIGQRGGLLAAALLALFPVFREHGPLSFVEPLSALLLLTALWAFIEQRTWLAAISGALAMYGKVDSDRALPWNRTPYLAPVPAERAPAAIAPCVAGAWHSCALSGALGWAHLRDDRSPHHGRRRSADRCLSDRCTADAGADVHIAVAAGSSGGADRHARSAGGMAQ